MYLTFKIYYVMFPDQLSTPENCTPNNDQSSGHLIKINPILSILQGFLHNLGIRSMGLFLIDLVPQDIDLMVFHFNDLSTIILHIIMNSLVVGLLKSQILRI